MSAAEGEYGSVSYNRDALYAKKMIEEIKSVMPDAAYFTREDLLHLPCLQHVATITRYHYVCKAVAYAIERKWMMRGDKTELYLAGGSKKYAQSEHDVGAYIPAIVKLINDNTDGWFAVFDIVGYWENDQHLTLNAKRSIVRRAIKHLVHRNFLKSVGLNIYEKV